MTDLHTLGKAMRDALQYLIDECDPDMDEDYNPHSAPVARGLDAIAAFDKALAETPAPAIRSRVDREGGFNAARMHYPEEMPAAPFAPADVAGLVERLRAEEQRQRRVYDHVRAVRDKREYTFADLNGILHAISGRDPVQELAADALAGLERERDIATTNYRAAASAIVRLNARIAEPREALRTASDLLAERTYGNPARSPGHNARVVMEAALAASETPASGARPRCPWYAFCNDPDQCPHKKDREHAAGWAADKEARP